MVGERIRELKKERKRAEASLADTEPDLEGQDGIALSLEQASEALNDVPDLSEALTKVDPKIRCAVYEAFRNIRDLEDLAGLVANGSIAGTGFEPVTFGL